MTFYFGNPVEEYLIDFRFYDYENFLNIDNNKLLDKVLIKEENNKLLEKI